MTTPFKWHFPDEPCDFEPSEGSFYVGVDIEGDIIFMPDDVTTVNGITNLWRKGERGVYALDLASVDLE